MGIASRRNCFFGMEAWCVLCTHGGSGYPGEIQDDNSARWIWWAMAMVPFCYVVQTLLVGLSEATSRQPEAAKGLIVQARYLTAISWCTYPGVYIIKMVGLSGAYATCAEQIGYSVSDVVAKAVFGVLIWGIAAAKSEDEVPLANKGVGGEYQTRVEAESRLLA